MQLLPAVFVVWPPKNVFHLFFCKSWAPFLKVKQRWAPFLPRLSGILPRYLGILFGFSGILPKFSEMLPGFSTNQNFWGCACTPYTPASNTTGLKHTFFCSQYLELRFHKSIRRLQSAISLLAVVSLSCFKIGSALTIATRTSRKMVTSWMRRRNPTLKYTFGTHHASIF